MQYTVEEIDGVYLFICVWCDYASEDADDLARHLCPGPRIGPAWKGVMDATAERLRHALLDNPHPPEYMCRHFYFALSHIDDYPVVAGLFEQMVEAEMRGDKVRSAWLFRQLDDVVHSEDIGNRNAA